MGGDLAGGLPVVVLGAPEEMQMKAEPKMEARLPASMGDSPPRLSLLICCGLDGRGARGEA